MHRRNCVLILISRFQTPGRRWAHGPPCSPRTPSKRRRLPLPSRCPSSALSNPSGTHSHPRTHTEPPKGSQCHNLSAMGAPSGLSRYNARPLPPPCHSQPNACQGQPVGTSGLTCGTGKRHNFNLNHQHQQIRLCYVRMCLLSFRDTYKKHNFAQNDIINLGF